MKTLIARLCAVLVLIGASAPAFADKILSEERIGDSPITYEGVLTNGGSFSGSVALNSYNVPDQWDYWSFFGTAGSAISIAAHRLTSRMDPGISLFFGVTNDNAGMNYFGSSQPGMIFLQFADDNNGIPHGVGGPFADPIINMILPSTGMYTLGVFDVLGSSTGPWTYELHVSGVSTAVPAPASLLLIAGGLLGLGLRRRSKAALR